MVRTWIKNAVVLVGMMGGTWMAMCAMPAAAAPQQAAGNLVIASARGGTLYCLDARLDSSAQKAQVFVAGCQLSPTQRWTVTRDGDGSSVIIGAGGLCLDSRVDHAADGVPVQLTSCQFDASQRFRLQDDGRILEASSNECLMIQPVPESGSPDPKAVVAAMRRPDFDVARFAEREQAPLIVAGCQARALQFWRLRP